MHITTLPVHSKLANAADIRKVFGDRELPLSLSQHQLATYQALCNPDIDVVINTAMTGDGKSLAGLLPLLSAHKNILALYPTNELAQDQLRSSELTLPDWGRSSRDVGQISGPILDELLEAAEHLSRGDVLLREMHTHSLVLSNPDLLHAITQFFYQQYGRASTHVVHELPMLFEQLTFDEFHIFDAAQITAVLTSLLFLYELSPYHRFKTLFLSATPDQRLLIPLKELGFGSRLVIINPQQQGWYAHGPDPGAGWRQILRGSEIEFVPKRAEEWIEEGVQHVILPWFEQYGKRAKAAIIVNSIASALRLVEKLRLLLPELRIEPNTGLNGLSTRKASYDADILVGTSTVDVGVDFHINLLIFESSNAGTFMQRLGRLGRHAGYTQENHFYPFQAYRAVALVPTFIYERLFQECDGQPAKLHDGDVLQRDTLNTIISSGVFPPPTEFKHYTKLWGRFQPAKVMQMLSEKAVKQTFADLRTRLEPRYKVLTSTSMGKTQIDWRSYRESGDEQLVREAQAFRGSSAFPCGILKAQENQVLSYNLLWILENANIELLSTQAFHAEANTMGYAVRTTWAKRQLFFFRWLELFEQRQFLTVRLTPTVSRWGNEQHHTAQLLPGFTLDGGFQPSLNQINNKLITYPTVGLLIPDFDPQQVRRTFYLPITITLLAYSNAIDSEPRTGTIAFGRDALLLDSHLRYRKFASSATAMIY